MASLNPYQAPSRTRVKICGITRLDDAQVAVAAGADALGFVFYDKSPRAVSIEQAKVIFKQLPAFVTTTALFVNPEPAEVEAVVKALKVDLLQFHGDETAGFCEQFNRPYIKAIRMQAETPLSTLAQTYQNSCGLLLDTYVKGVPGGTGEAFNWAWVSTEQQAGLTLPIILAGGLNEANVEQAIQAVHPWGVDVSGGVEASHGIKAEEKVRAFLDAVNNVI